MYIFLPMLVYVFQWAMFLLLIAAIVYGVFKIAGKANARPKTQWIAGIGAGAVAFLALNIPNLQGFIGRAYFNHLCEKEAGEFIYKTVDNVEGLYQMRPRDPRDYFDRLSHGDIPEDPYGHTNVEAQAPQVLFVSPPFVGYLFFENDLPAAARP